MVPPTRSCLMTAGWWGTTGSTGPRSACLHSSAAQRLRRRRQAVGPVRATAQDRDRARDKLLRRERRSLSRHRRRTRGAVGARHWPLAVALLQRKIGHLEHDPEKWEPVFGKDRAQTKS